jgi:hypothetical protein
MAESFIQVALDGAGKMVRNFANVIGGNTVYQQVVSRAKSDGTILDDESTEATQLLIKAKTDNLDAALSTRATEATVALIKAKTDNLDVALSTRTKPADQQHVLIDNAAVEITNDVGNPLPVSATALPLPTGASTEATLALIAKDATLGTVVDQPGVYTVLDRLKKIDVNTKGVATEATLRQVLTALQARPKAPATATLLHRS